jgi:hypothetical protein
MLVIAPGTHIATTIKIEVIFEIFLPGEHAVMHVVEGPVITAGEASGWGCRLVLGRWERMTRHLLSWRDPSCRWKRRTQSAIGGGGDTA